MKTLIHIIPTLQNGGAETVLSRLVEEFYLSEVKQYVITLLGAPNDFHYSEISKYAKVLDWKTDPSKVDQTIIKNSDAPMLAWMYSAILFSHKLKRRLKTQNPITWNIRHSSFRWNQLYQKAALYGFAVWSHLKAPKVIYCSNRSKEIHEKYFFSKENRTVIQNRLAKKMKPLSSEFLPEEKPFLLYVGRYDPAKGPDRLIKIAQEFFKYKESYSLTIAGSGWKVSMIPQDLRGKVLLAGNVSNIIELYQQADVLLFTSYTEGYPNVLVEASVSGTPIIGFEAGDSKLILDAYDLGYSVETQSEFINCLDKLTKKLPSKDQKIRAAQKQIKLLDFSLTVKEYKEFIAL